LERRGLQRGGRTRAEAAALETGGVAHVRHQIVCPLVVQRYVIVEVGGRGRHILAIDVAGRAGDRRVEVGDPDGRVLLVRGVATTAGDRERIGYLKHAVRKHRPVLGLLRYVLVLLVDADRRIRRGARIQAV